MKKTDCGAFIERINGLMNFYVLTLFPEMIMNGLSEYYRKSYVKGVNYIEAINIRDFAGNKHYQVDDYPYGGGAGMVMQPGPVYRSYESVVERMAVSESCLPYAAGQCV